MRRHSLCQIVIFLLTNAWLAPEHVLSADPAEFVPPKMTAKNEKVAPFEYSDVGPKIPNYTPGGKWGAQGPPKSLMQRPLAPEESAKHFVTPVGFAMRLFATEPHLGGKPVAMAWDDRGRLWVCETVDYPNALDPAGRGHDRIRICEDVDRDGKADQFTIFATDLSIPTAIAFYRGGAIVQNGAETLYLADTDSDDRADVRRVLISGWATNDTHGGVSNFRYGLDNWIWAMQGYNPSSPQFRDQKIPEFRMGFFRFKLDGNDPPTVTDVEFLRSTDNNTWGLGMSEEGLVFGSTANRNPSVYMPIPNRYYERVRGWIPRQLEPIADTHRFSPITENIRQVDHFGGYTAGAGHAIYTARAYPRQWWNRTAFVCGPTGHLVGTFVLQPDGAGFRSSSPCNLVASNDEWTAPIMAEVGPDGFVWILDWYNFIVQHNPTPRGFKTGKGAAYESDLRDKRHGRIYRLVYSAAAMGRGQGATSLHNAAPQQLVAALRHPTMLWRLHAQRLLVERGKRDVVPALIELTADTSVDEAGLNVGAIHALWTLHGLCGSDCSSKELLAAASGALRHPSAGVRRNAVMVLPAADDSRRALLASGVLAEEDAQVRLAAVLALADMPPDESIAIALARRVRDNAVADRWIGEAITSAAAANGISFLKAIASQDSEALATQGADYAAAVLRIVTIVSEHIARGKPSREETIELISILAAANPSVSQSVVRGLTQGWPDGYHHSVSDSGARDIEELLQRYPIAAKVDLIRLMKKWSAKEVAGFSAVVADSLRPILFDASVSDAERVAASKLWIRAAPNQNVAVEGVLGAVTPQASSELARGLIEAVSASRAENVGPMLVDLHANLTPATRSKAIDVLLLRPTTTATLLDEIESGGIRASDLGLEQVERLQAHPVAALRRRAVRLLRQRGGLPSPDRQKVLEGLLSVADTNGDAIRGKAVFEKQCQKCHAHNGFGETIGPDLTGMFVRSKSELLTNVIDPSRDVEGNFRAYNIVAGGLVYSGSVTVETRNAIEVVDVEGKRHVVQRDDIDEVMASQKSIMPDGFEQLMSRTELSDLLEFLTVRQRFVPLSLRSTATAVSTVSLFEKSADGPDRMIFADWKPKAFRGVPFLFVEPKEGNLRNIILLHGPKGTLPPTMPKSVRLPCGFAAKSIHLLSGVSGWGYPAHKGHSVSMTVRLHYADGQAEDHALRNGIHFADYIRRVDVPESEYAFAMRNQQMRYLAIRPKRPETIKTIEFIKGNDPTAPMVLAVTVECP